MTDRRVTWHGAARWVLAACLVAAIAAHGRPCRASDASDSEKAEQLIRSGNALRRNGQDARALPMFQQAYELSRTPRTAAQLGLAELALGYWDAAADHLTEALTSGRNPWVDKNRSAIDASLTQAKSHLASVVVKGGPAGAEVLVNGKSVGTLPLSEPVRVNEGRIETEVRASGYKSNHRVLTVEGSSTANVTVNLEPVAAAPAGETSPPKSAVPGGDDPQTAVASVTRNGDRPSSGTELPGWRRVLPWALTAGALAAGGIGIWQALNASKSSDQFNAVGNMACNAGDPMHGSDPSCAGLYADWSSHRRNAWIGIGVGGALAAGAAALFVWNAYAAPVDVQVGMSGAQVSFQGTF